MPRSVARPCARSWRGRPPFRGDSRAPSRRDRRPRARPGLAGGRCLAAPARRRQTCIRAQGTLADEMADGWMPGPGCRKPGRTSAPGAARSLAGMARRPHRRRPGWGMTCRPCAVSGVHFGRDHGLALAGHRIPMPGSWRRWWPSRAAHVRSRWTCGPTPPGLGRVCDQACSKRFVALASSLGSGEMQASPQFAARRSRRLPAQPTTSAPPTAALAAALELIRAGTTTTESAISSAGGQLGAARDWQAQRSLQLLITSACKASRA